jgi:hypothetical protein
MKKFNVIPGVVVYKNVIKDIDKVFNIIKDSENYIAEFKESDPNLSIYVNDSEEYPAKGNGFEVIRPWTAWYNFGSKSQFTFMNSNSTHDDKIIQQIDMRKEIIDAHFLCYDEYVKDWKDKLEWPHYVSSWVLAGGLQQYDPEWNNINPIWFSSLEILKHHPHPERQLAIPWHTDFRNHWADAKGAKFVLTITVYLNDDYEGGEVQFVNINEQKLVTYKPQAGDITIFPGAHPFWHSAMPVKSGYKYFTRILLTVDYPGTKEWQEERNKYDDDSWEKIQEERILKETLSGNFNIIPVVEGHENEPRDSNSKIIIIKKENDIYIDGKNV